MFQPLCEKYRPKQWKDLYLCNEQFQKLKNVNVATFPHLLIYGNAGTGKNSFIQLYMNDIAKNTTFQFLNS